MRPSLSGIVLVLTNLLPIGGVIWFGWSVLEILVLYWTESVAIGIVNVARMATSRSLAAGATGRLGIVGALEAGNSTIPLKAMKLFIAPFFAVHYGLFCFAHISAIIFLFSASAETADLLQASNIGFWLAVAGIFASHILSFFANFLGKGEYRRVGLIVLMNRPYGRIVAMHIAIIAGAFLATRFGAPLATLVLLVLVKTAIDLGLHQRERARFAVEAVT